MSEAEVVELVAPLSLSKTEVVEMDTSLPEVDGGKTVEGRSLSEAVEWIERDFVKSKASVDEKVIVELKSLSVSSVVAEVISQTRWRRIVERKKNSVSGRKGSGCS